MGHIFENLFLFFFGQMKNFLFWDFFSLFFLYLGDFFGFFLKKFMGATSKALFWTFFGPFFVWAHLRDLFEDFMDTL